MLFTLRSQTTLEDAVGLVPLNDWGLDVPLKLIINVPPLPPEFFDITPLFVTLPATLTTTGLAFALLLPY
jgi:hypothetical protein